MIDCGAYQVLASSRETQMDGEELKAAEAAQAALSTAPFSVLNLRNTNTASITI
jgi:hypothetical protein